jgi:hypothetical protein
MPSVSILSFLGTAPGALEPARLTPPSALEAQEAGSWGTRMAGRWPDWSA